MYPVLFRIGSFEVTSFGVMVALAALVGLSLFRRELQRSALPRDAADAGIVGIVGGLMGAKLLWTVPVHPTQLYEAIGLGLLGLLLLRWRRSGVRDTIVLGRYVVGAGTLRFFVEFIRVNERIAFGLSIAHLVSLAAIVVGVGILVVSLTGRRTAYSPRNST